MKRRTLTDDEKRLWDQVTRLDKPLDNGWRMTDNRHEKLSKPIVSEHSTYFAISSSSPAIRYPSLDLALGVYAGIDRSSAERFRKGEMPLDGTIDLHGMSREKAHMALMRFVHLHYDRGSRCLLAITGKGSSSAPSGGRGILREMLPQWVVEPGLRPMILAFDIAKSKHGGSGAYYILLRRIRNG